MMANKFYVLLLCLSVVNSLSSYAQVADSSRVNPTANNQYYVGLASFNRFSYTEVNLSFEQDLWAVHGGGVSVMRYTSERMFWSVSFGYAVANVNQERVRDIRVVLDPITNQYNEVEYGTRTEEWQYQYYTLPISLNYSLAQRKSTRMYATGGIDFDWIRRFNRAVDATYDGKFDYISAGRFKDVSSTVRAGLGLYQSIGRHFVATIDSTLGYTFFSDFAEASRARRKSPYVAIDLKLYYNLSSLGNH